MESPFGEPKDMSGSTSTDEHRAEAPRSVNCAVLTVSDTRTRQDDHSGQLVRQHLDWRGHTIAAYEIVPDDAPAITEVLGRWIADDGIQAIITNGGTGIAGRDVTYDAITGLIEKRLDGFGEIFRMLSFSEIGAAAMLSRAVAGVSNNTALFATPGSSNAVRLAMEKLIGPEIAHVVHEITK